MVQLEPTTCDVYIFGHLNEFDRDELERFDSITYSINGEGTYSNGSLVKLLPGEYTISFNEIDNAEIPDDLIITITNEMVMEGESLVFTGKYKEDGFCYIIGYNPYSDLNNMSPENNSINYNYLLEQTTFSTTLKTATLFKHLNIIDFLYCFNRELYILTDYAIYYQEDYVNNDIPIKICDLPEKALKFGNVNSQQFIDQEIFENFYEYEYDSYEEAYEAYYNDYTFKSNNLFIIMENGELYLYNQYSNISFGTGHDLTLIENSEELFKIETFNDDDKKVIDVSIGSNHILALLENGDVYSVGSNDYGQLGLGTEVEVDTFTKIDTLSNINFITADEIISLFINTNGDVFGCGLNYFGTMPDEYTTSINEWINKKILTPIQITHDFEFNLLPPMKEIFSYGNFLMKSEDNDLYSTGITQSLYKHCAFEDGYTKDYFELTEEPIENGIYNINTVDYNYFLTEDRLELYFRLSGDNNRYLNNNCSYQNKFTKVNYNWQSPIKEIYSDHDFISVDSVSYINNDFCMVKLDNDDIYIWGNLENSDYNDYSTFKQNLDIIEDYIDRPKRIRLFEDSVVEKMIGSLEYDDKIYYLLNTGELYEKYYENKTLIDSNIVNVVCNLSVGMYYITNDNTFKRKRLNGSIDTLLNNVKFVQYRSYSGSSYFSTNYEFTIVLQNGDIYQFTDEYNTRYNPVGYYYSPSLKFSEISGRFTTSLHVVQTIGFYNYTDTYFTKYFVQKDNYDIYVWGSNYSSSLGVNSVSNTISLTRIPISFSSKIDKIYATIDSTIIYFENGDLYCAGSNTYGQIGLGSSSITQLFTKSDVANVKELIFISNYYERVTSGNYKFGTVTYIAITNDGNIYGWGRNFETTRDISYFLGTSGEYVTQAFEMFHGIAYKEFNYEKCYLLTNSGELYNWGYYEGEYGNREIEKIFEHNNIKKILFNDDMKFIIILLYTGEIYYYILYDNVNSYDYSINNENYFYNEELYSINANKILRFNEYNYNRFIDDTITDIILANNFDLVSLYLISENNVYCLGYSGTLSGEATNKGYLSLGYNKLKHYNNMSGNYFIPERLINIDSIKTYYNNDDYSLNKIILTNNNRIFKMGYCFQTTFAIKSLLSDFFKNISNIKYISKPGFEIYGRFSPCYFILENGDIYITGQFMSHHETEDYESYYLNFFNSVIEPIYITTVENPENIKKVYFSNNEPNYILYILMNDGSLKVMGDYFKFNTKGVLPNPDLSANREISSELKVYNYNYPDIRNRNSITNSYITNEFVKNIKKYINLDMMSYYSGGSGGDVY